MSILESGVSEAMLARLTPAQRAALTARLAKARTPVADVVARLPDDVVPPMSSAQRRLWFLHQYDPQDPSYGIPVAFTLDGPLDTVALGRALTGLAEAHDVLHTVYPATDGEPAPTRRPDVVPELRILEVTGRSDADVLTTALADVRRAYDLAGGSPLRATVYRQSPNRALLLVEVHHIAADGWSLNLLLAELGHRYDAALDTALDTAAADDVATGPRPLRYGDVAAWQRDRLTGDVLRRELAWWGGTLADAPGPLALPTDRPRPAVATTAGARFERTLPATLAAAVRAGAGRDGVTPFMLWLAGLGVALGRICGTDDLVVGAPVAGRLRAEFEDVVGCFVSTLPLRVGTAGDPTGAQLLDRVRTGTLAAYDHQELPFELLVEHFAPQRDLSTTALFQVMLNVHNQPLLDLRMAGLRAHWVDIDTATSKFDLSVAVVDTDDRMTVGWTYNRDLFDEGTVQRVAAAVEAAIAGLCADPDAAVATLPLAPAPPSPPPFRSTGGTVHGLIHAAAQRLPDSVAVSANGVDCTYAELRTRANQLAHELGARGVGPGDVVAVFCEPSVDWAVAVLATLTAGAAYLPVDARYPASRVAAMIADAGAAAVLTQSSLGYVGGTPSHAPNPAGVDPDGTDRADGTDGSDASYRTSAGRRGPHNVRDDLQRSGDLIIVIDAPTTRAALDARPDTDPEIELAPGALAYLLFTSGSTGRPKAVAVTHEGVLAYLDGVRERAGLQPGWSFAQVSTLAADLGNTNVFGALTGGGRLHLLSYEQATDPDVLADYFARHRVDAMKLVPSHFAVLLGAADAVSVVPHRLLVLAGETCRPELVARARQLRPDVLVHNHYGPTETTVSVIGAEVPDPVPSTIALGTPIGASVCHVLDAGMAPVPAGLPGELYVGGPGVARGYHGRPALTADRFVPDPFDTAGGRLYRTGDRVRRRDDGALEFLGRVDAQVKIRGYRVEPGEVEAALAAQPEVAQAAVRTWGGETDVRLAGYLVLASGHTADAVTAVRDRLRSSLPDHLVPSSLTVLDMMPRNANGKLDRAALPEPSATAAASGTYAAPTSELEIEIAAVFAEILGVERVGLDDNFFDLGGESFRAVRVARRISRPVRVIDVFTRPTVRGLAAHLTAEADGDGEERLLHRLTPPGRHPEIALVCVPYGGGSAITYQPLADAMDERSALWALQLPGHDPSRPDEPPVGLREVARRCAAEVRERVAGDVVVYGHCLGGAMAVEIARLLEESGRTVRGVVLAGTFPAARLPGRVFGTLNRLFPADRWTSTRAYREFLRSLGGVDDDAPPAEQEQLIAALRHDLREAEEYYTEAFAEGGTTTLTAPVLCVVGERDRATELYQERAAEWAHFSPRVDLAVIPRAGHYFLKHQAATLAATLRVALTRWAPATSSRATPEPLPDGVRLAPARVPDAAARTSLRAFGVLAAGQFVSLIGTSLSAFALGVYVFTRTGQVSAFALTLFTATAPAILAAPLAGAVADRYNRRLVMLTADTAAFAAMAVLALLFVTDRLDLWHVYAVTAVGSLANAFQRPAYFAAIAQLVPKRYLGHVNGIALLGVGAGELIAPLIGGALVGLIGLGGVLAIDAVSFAIGVTALLAVRIPDLAFHRLEEPLLRSITSGWRYITRRPGLVAMVVFFVVFNFLFSLPQALITPLVLTTAGPATLGLVASAAGIGMLLGNLMMSVWGGTARRATGMVGGTLITGAAAVVAGLGSSPWLLAAGMAGLFFSLMIINAHWLALIQTKVGLELQGRVVATNQMLATATLPLGFAVAGPLVSLASGDAPDQIAAIRWVLLGTGVALAVWGVVGLRWRRLHHLEDGLHDAVPDVEVGSIDEEQAAADARLLAADSAGPRSS